MRSLILLTTIFSSFFSVVFASSQKPLSAEEADAIVLAQAEAKASKEAARVAELNQVEILSEGVIDQGERKLIIREIVPPKPQPNFNLAQPSVAPPSTFDPSENDFKQTRSLFLSANVYDRALTCLRWAHEGTDYEIWTNVDFNHLSSLGQFETEEASYMVVIGLGNFATGNTGFTASVSEDEIPELPPFTAGQAEYFVVQGDPAHETAFEGVEAILAHYETNRKELEIAFQRREALQAARQRYKAAHPEKPKNLILNFWDNEPAPKRQQ